MYKTTEKICSFYASELHLTTILTQYIYEKTKEGRKILNVLEKDLIKEAQTVIELINCKESLKSDIENVGWKKFNLDRITELKESYNEDIIIVAGSKQFIEKMKNFLPDNNTVVDCYELLERADEAMDVIKEHEYILMTNGVKKTTEIFA